MNQVSKTSPAFPVSAPPIQLLRPSTLILILFFSYSTSGLQTILRAPPSKYIQTPHLTTSRPSAQTQQPSTLTWSNECTSPARLSASTPEITYLLIKYGTKIPNLPHHSTYTLPATTPVWPGDHIWPPNTSPEAADALLFSSDPTSGLAGSTSNCQCLYLSPETVLLPLEAPLRDGN